MIKAETTINNNQVAIRVHTPDGNHTDITVNEAMELATTLYNNAVEAAGLEALITRDDNPNKPLDNRYARIGDNYSIFNWKRAATGIYVTTAQWAKVDDLIAQIDKADQKQREAAEKANRDNR